VSHICNYCGNETAGADPCPWCNGSMGVVAEKPKIEPVVVHDDVRSFNPWPILGVLLLVLVVSVILLQRKKNVDQIEAATRQVPNYVVSNQPLFQSRAVTPPKLARTTSIKSSGLPSEVEKPTPPKVVATEPDDTEDDVDDTPDEATPPTVRPESVQLTDVQLASQSDGDGHELALGTATIYNSSPYEITNFDLYVAAGGGTYRLQPFSGTPDNPVALPSRSIPAGGRITVPIMSTGTFDVSDPTASKTVSVEAIENGATVTSHVTIS
jgi:hypothetical protein